MAQAADAAWDDDSAGTRDGTSRRAGHGAVRAAASGASGCSHLRIHCVGMGGRLASTRASASRVHRGRYCTACVDTAQTLDRIHGRLAADRSVARRLMRQSLPAYLVLAVTT